MKSIGLDHHYEDHALKAEESRQTPEAVVRVYIGCNILHIRSWKEGGPSVCHGPLFQGAQSKAEVSGGMWPILHLQVIRQIVSAFVRCKVASSCIPSLTHSIPQRCQNTCRPGVTLFVTPALPLPKLWQGGPLFSHNVPSVWRAFSQGLEAAPWCSRSHPLRLLASSPLLGTRSHLWNIRHSWWLHN